MKISTLRRIVLFKRAVITTPENIVRDLSLLWAYRHLMIKPAIFTCILLYLVGLVKFYLPWLFIEIGLKDEAYGALVLLPVGVLHGILLSSAFNVITEQNDRITEAIRDKDFKKFVSYFFRRIAPQIKVYIFALSAIIVYSVICCDFGNIITNYVASWFATFIITMAWFAAYELDDPLSAMRSVRKYIPLEWQKELSPYIIGSFKRGKVRLVKDAEFKYVFSEEKNVLDQVK